MLYTSGYSKRYSDCSRISLLALLVVVTEQNHAVDMHSSALSLDTAAASTAAPNELRSSLVFGFILAVVFSCGAGIVLLSLDVLGLVPLLIEPTAHISSSVEETGHRFASFPTNTAREAGTQR